MYNKLTEDSLLTLLQACFYPEGSITQDTIPDDAMKVRGVSAKLVFDPKNIKEQHDNILSMVMLLPRKFRASVSPSGAAFHDMVEDVDGNMWTDNPLPCDGLLCLGMAAGIMDFTNPRDTWSPFEGVFPQIVIRDTPQAGEI